MTGELLIKEPILKCPQRLMNNGKSYLRSTSLLVKTVGSLRIVAFFLLLLEMFLNNFILSGCSYQLPNPIGRRGCVFEIQYSDLLYALVRCSTIKKVQSITMWIKAKPLSVIESQNPIICIDPGIERQTLYVKELLVTL